MSAKVSQTIKRAAKDSRICSKFAKSVSTPKVTLPIANTFNEIRNHRACKVSYFAPAAEHVYKRCISSENR